MSSAATETETETHTMRILRKDVGIPDFVQEMLDRGSTFKSHYTIAGVAVRARITDWRSIADSRIMDRQCDFWMNSGDKVGYGRMRFVRLTGKDYCSEDIWDIMDAQSQTLMELADVLTLATEKHSGFFEMEICDLLSEGTIVMLDEVWTEQGFPPGKWAEVMHTFMQRRCGRYTPVTAIAMKAFPLEYHSRDVPPDKHRLSAMFRYYNKLFGVTPVPGSYGDEGWLVNILI